MALAGPALAAEPPTVSLVEPKKGVTGGGTAVTIIGTGFTGAQEVMFGASAAMSFGVHRPAEITALSPAGTGTVDVTVTTPGGTSATSKADQFTYVAPPTVTKVEPNHGPEGGATTVTITGTGFTGAQTEMNGVMFGASAASPAVRSDTEITVLSPAGTGTVDVTVTTPFGTSATSKADQFTYVAPTIQHWYRSGVKLKEGTSVPIVMFGGAVNLELNGVNCRFVGGGTIENPVGGGAGVGRTNSLEDYECKGAGCEEYVLRELGVQGYAALTFGNNPAATNEPGFPGWSDSLEENVIAGVNSVREKIGEPAVIPNREEGQPFETFKTPAPAGMIRASEVCRVLSTGQVVVKSLPYEGELKPEIGAAKTGNLNGANSAKPSQFSFNGSSTGGLLSEPVCLLNMEGPPFVYGPCVSRATGSLKYLGYNEQELITVKP
jgi:hypothetical protein